MAASTHDTMATKYLLDISASKGTYLTEEKLSQHLHSTKGVERRFKVQGENRVIAVVCNDSQADGIASGLQSSDLDSTAVDTTCTPIVPYEHFAKTSLGVTEAEVEKKGETPAFNPEKETYWIQVDIGYNGHTLEELKAAWHQEAVVALGLVHGGQVPIVLYKTVFVNQVHLIVQMDGAALDALNLQLPLFQAFGDTIKTTTKRIKAF